MGKYLVRLLYGWGSICGPIDGDIPVKLGIVVVYLVTERNEALLDLHLRQIEKNTQVPYTIYGSANRLLTQFREKLEKDPKVRICECVPYEDTHIERRYEHSFYLEQLIKAAVEDGVSHVCILHVDSFPVYPGWAEELAGRLSDKCVLAGIQRDDEIDQKPMTACMFFHRDFYLEECPRLLLTESELDSEKYKQYVQEYPHSADSGVGYGFKIFARGLSWYPLRNSDRNGREAMFGRFHGDLIFHLSSAVQIEDSPSILFRNVTVDLRSPFRRFMAGLAKIILPSGIKDRLKRRLPESMRPPREDLEKAAFERVRQKLLQDPESFITALRDGKRP